jgi:acetyltransferase
LRAHLRLRDGREVLVRPIHRDDSDELRQAFSLLSEASRFQRFHTGTPALSERVARYLTDIDHTNHEALVAVAEGTTDIVGVARFIRSRVRPAEAELAITVADDWHRAGLATKLLGLLADRARSEGVEAFTVEMLDDNAAVLEFVQVAGGVVESIHEGLVSGRIALRVNHAPADPA